MNTMVAVSRRLIQKIASQYRAWKLFELVEYLIEGHKDFGRRQKRALGIHAILFIAAGDILPEMLRGPFDGAVSKELDLGGKVVK